MGKGYYIAVDYGASGGKMAAARFDGSSLILEEYLTFPNRSVELAGTLYWDVFALYTNILDGLAEYRARGIYGTSLGIDTWGASYGFLDAKGRLLEPVYHYRDVRTDGIMESMFDRVSRRELFEMTGCQCNRTYTLPQLYSCVAAGDTCLHNAKTLLFLPDLLGYFLSGVISNEMTIAGTSALLEPSQENWAPDVFHRFEIPTHFLTPLVDAGTTKGMVSKRIAQSVGLDDICLSATIGHDSAAAVAAIPGFGENKLYVSIGTNISMGIELDKPLVSEKAFLGGFKNTGGIGRKKIVYRDFSAFWMINGLRATWKAYGKEYSFDDLHTLATQAKSCGSYIDMEDASLNNAGGDMLERMTVYLQETKQKIPASVGEWVLCVFESIALKVKYVAEFLSKNFNIPINEAFVINGGSRNILLVQFIADALALPVKAGMPYATLIGNLLGQLLADKSANDLEELRAISANSCSMSEYSPKAGRDWDGALATAIAKGICT